MSHEKEKEEDKKGNQFFVFILFIISQWPYA